MLDSWVMRQEKKMILQILFGVISGNQATAYLCVCYKCSLNYNAENKCVIG